MVIKAKWGANYTIIGRCIKKQTVGAIVNYSDLSSRLGQKCVSAKWLIIGGKPTQMSTMIIAVCTSHTTLDLFKNHLTQRFNASTLEAPGPIFEGVCNPGLRCLGIPCFASVPMLDIIICIAQMNCSLILSNPYVYASATGASLQVKHTVQ